MKRKKILNSTKDIDFENDTEIRSPGWIRYQKKLK